MSLKNALIALFCGLLLPVHAHAEILFEAFYRIEKNGRHTGYLVERIASDVKGNKIMSAYIRTRQGNREVYTTMKSTAKAGSAAAVETVHVSNNTGAPYKIFSQFKNGKGTVSYTSNNARKPGLVKTTALVTYPSAFTYYVADLTKFQPGIKYAYTAFFEETGTNQPGQLSVLGAKEAAGKRVFQLLNDDSGQPIESFVAENGDQLGSRSISTGSTCFWVATKEEAVGDMAYPTGEMTALFGDLPQGKKNIWSKSPGFRSIDLINGFIVWDGARAISSAPAGKVIAQPVRGL